MYATLPTQYETLIAERAGSVIFLTLDRPEARNAMNRRMIEEICAFFVGLQYDRSVRCVVIRGAEETFCAGADIKEMRDPAHQTPDAQRAYAHALDDMLLAVQRAPQVTIAVVEGAAMGGGFGLLCVTDIAIAAAGARLSLPEVRLGIAPAVISPYVIERIGLTRARQLALTGRVLDGRTAHDIGLVQDVAEPSALDDLVTGYVRDVLHGSPDALAATKSLLFQVAAASSLAESRITRVETLCHLRSGEEGREGMAAFAEKRKPAWVTNEESLTP